MGPASTDPLSHLAQGGMGPIGPLTAVLGPTGVLWFSMGIAGVVMGIFLVAFGSLIDFIAGNSGPNCSSNPLCANAPELHFIFVLLGLLLVILGIVSAVYAFRRGVVGSPWMTLPP